MFSLALSDLPEMLLVPHNLIFRVANFQKYEWRIHREDSEFIIVTIEFFQKERWKISSLVLSITKPQVFSQEDKSRPSFLFPNYFSHNVKVVKFWVLALFNPLVPNALFFHSLKTSENLTVLNLKIINNPEN